ncbi:MAG: hydroxymethylglutaryl-CoA synthase family protein [Desulfobacterium sp.]|nr:hydroxymethylglutaryl-CoA synthase family protein [Desulfobacterium sp.]
MAGIRDYGAYIPYNRLERSSIAQTWGGYPKKGEKAVANFDEDTVTMAVEAARACLSQGGNEKVDRFYFASTTAPYAEKQAASLAAAALDLSPGAFTMDVAGSLRAGTSGICAALDALRGNSATNALVTASDMRLGAPNGAKEMDFGDGAAALVLARDDVIAEIDAYYTVNHEIFDQFRPADHPYVLSWEDRFVREMGFSRVVVKAVTAAMAQFNVSWSDITIPVLTSPNPGYLKGIAKKFGWDPKLAAMDAIYPRAGNTGCAHSFLLLCHALDRAEPGDRILWANYGDGCDVMLLTVTDRILERKRGGVETQLATGSPTTYPKYLRWRNLVETEPPMRPRQEPVSAPALYRDRRCGMALQGSKCRECGTVQYPVQRICMNCRAKDSFDYYAFADRQGRVVTFSHDLLGVTPDPPTTVAAVDFEEGGRIMVDITDRDPKEIAINMAVEMTFRKFRRTNGIQVYWWKSRPVRKAQMMPLGKDQSSTVGGVAARVDGGGK